MLHKITPLILDSTFSCSSNKTFLKMDCYQPAGSFKIRGIGFLCAYEAANGALGFVSSSGGNAGLAVTYASHQLNLPCTIVVPSTTPQKVRQKMIEQGATVYEKGSVWDESDKFARAFFAVVLRP